MKAWIKEHKKLSIIIGVVTLLLIGFIASFIVIYNQAYHSLIIECGAAVNASDFMKDSTKETVFVDPSTDISKLTPGEYKIKIHSGLFTHTIKVNMVDTTAPVANSNDLVTPLGTELMPEEFVSDVFDENDITIDFTSKPDFNKVGETKVNVVIKDIANNELVVESNLTVVPFKTSFEVEAGSKALTVNDFKLNDESFEITTDLDAINMNHVSDKNISINYANKTYTSTVSIIDTKEPTVSFINVNGFLGVPYKAEDFISSATDATDLKYELLNEIDTNSKEKQNITVAVSDEGGNTVSKEVTLLLVEDTEDPVLEGVHDIIVMEGNSVSYKEGVTYSDNCMEGLKFEVNADGVNTDKVGTYPVTYTVTDVAGHTVSASCNVIVQPRVYDINQINAAADRIIASIITPDMNDRDKSWAIYQWVRAHVAFTEGYIEGSYNKACYDGIVNWAGDCYVFACTSQTLLTRAGIKNMMINRIPGRRRHYWNLVDVDGTGWYHFDTTPRLDPTRPVFFLWTDEQMMNYSNTHYNCFNYDKEVFTGIN